MCTFNSKLKHMYDLYHSQVLTINDVKVESVSLVTRFSGHRFKEEHISTFNFQVTALLPMLDCHGFYGCLQQLGDRGG